MSCILKVLLFISSEVHSEKNVIVINIYRPPGTKVEQFMVSLEWMLEELSDREEYIYLVGDFNIDVTKYGIGTENQSSRLSNLGLSYDFKPVISLPTRLGKNRNTILDNILTNYPGNNQSGVIQTSISDHFPVFVSLHQKNTPELIREENKVWNYNKATITDYCKLIEEIEILEVSNHSSQELYTNFNKQMDEAHKKVFMKVEKKINYSNRLPWVDKRLKNMIRQKNMLYIKWNKYKTQTNHKNYKQYKIMCTRELKRAQREYYRYKIQHAHNSNKQQWCVINELLGKKTSIKIPKLPLKNDKEITNYYY